MAMDIFDILQKLRDPSYFLFFLNCQNKSFPTFIIF